MAMVMKYCTCLWFICFVAMNIATDCDLVQTKYGFVCRCTADYCDYLEKNKTKIENNNTIVIVSSNMEALRFKVTKGVFNNVATSDYIFKDDYSNFMTIALDATKPNKQFRLHISANLIVNRIRVNRSVEYQKVIGFGGALTGSVTHILKNLDSKLQDQIYSGLPYAVYSYRSYFDSNGINYNLIRLPIGGCDFDLMPWAYNEYPKYDKTLRNFTKLDERDLIKIQQIHRIKNVTDADNIKIMAAAWSPPPWMKSNNNWSGYSYLKSEYYQTWADYHLRFLELMSAKNITIWAISTGNEPLNGVIGWFFVHFMSLGWTPNDQAIYLDAYLGPTIKNSRFKNVLIFGNDDQRYTYPVWFQKMNSTRPNSLDYLDGLAVHWYWDNIFNPNLIDLTMEMFPNKLLLNTEACVGDKPWETHGPELGSWQRAEHYAKSLLQDFQHNFNGWIDWNLILNEYGGPNYVKNFVDAPIIVNTSNNKEFYKQPIYYVIGHFSKFIPSETVRIHSDTLTYQQNIDTVAFKSPNGTIVLIIFNSASIPQEIILDDSERGSFEFNVPPRSIHTLLYK